MNLKRFIYTEGKSRKLINVKYVSLLSPGLMFRKNSPPLLFSFNKEKRFSIHSYFCKPFTAIWLDKNKRVLKKIKISKWDIFSGTGKFLLEIPDNRQPKSI